MKMPSKLFGDDDVEEVSKFEIDEDYGRRLEYNRKREELQRYEELKQRGQIVDDSEDDDSEEESEPDDVIGDSKKELKFFDALLKVKRQDPSIKNEDVKLFESDEEKEDGDDDKKKKDPKKKQKKLYLKDVQGYVEEEDSDFGGKEEKKVKSYVEEQEELRKAVSDAVENDEDDEELFRETEKEGDDGFEEVDEELEKKRNEYFGIDGGKVADEGNKFLRDFFANRMWKEKDGKREMIDEAELEAEEDDEDAVEMQEEYELNYRHEENAGEIVMGHSRKVEGSVRKKDTARNVQRKNKEERMKMAEIEREEELKQLKNVKKKEIKEKMKKVFLVAGFKKGDEISLDAKDLEDEFDPEEYDKMMKAVFDDKYYDEEDSGLSSDEDGEKPDFDKEDELLGLPKDWDVTQGGDGFVTAREMALKHKEIVDAGGDDEKEEEEAEEEEEEKVEGKRKRKRKTSLVQRAKDALMEEYYKLDYEDTIGDLKTRFKYAKVAANRFDLETEEILGLDDSELNQYVPLKKMAPYREKDWEVNRHKVKEQKLKNKELLSQKKGKHDEKRSKKKSKKQSADVVDATTSKPASVAAEEGEATKLSRKAIRRRRQAEKKLPPNRMAAYGKSQ